MITLLKFQLVSVSSTFLITKFYIYSLYLKEKYGSSILSMTYEVWKIATFSCFFWINNLWPPANLKWKETKLVLFCMLATQLLTVQGRWGARNKTIFLFIFYFKTWNKIYEKILYSVGLTKPALKFCD